MSDIRLKIRHVKRGGETKLDISGMGLTEIPDEIFELTQLETLDISDNRIMSLGKIGALHKLKNLYAHKIKISVLPDDIKDLAKLENLKLDGNPVAVNNSKLSIVFGVKKVQDVLESYFDKLKDSPVVATSKPGFLSSTSSLNDVVFLRK